MLRVVLNFYAIKFNVKQIHCYLFFVKPKLYCFNHLYALQVSFFSLITHVVVTSSFGCVQNFVLIKLQLPMFLKVLHVPAQTSDLLPEQPLHTFKTRPLQKCPGLLLNAHWMPNEMLVDSDFFQHGESLLFSAVCFLKIC